MGGDVVTAIRPIDAAHRAATTSVHGILDAAGFIDKTGTAATDMPSMSAEFLPSTDWTLGAGWSGDFASGFTHASGGGTAALTQSKAAVNATPYQITYTVTGRTAGSFTLAFGGYVSGAITASGSDGPTSESTSSLVITPTTDFNGTVAISIKSIIGGSTPHIVLKDSNGVVRNEFRVSPQFGNTFTGLDAGRSNTTGSNNTFTGRNAGFSNTTGVSNTFTGFYAGFSNTTGGSNTFTGRDAGRSNTTGANNTFTGLDAGRSNTTGANNTFTGRDAGRYLANGSTANETSGNSVYIGYDARASVAGVVNEAAFGYQAIGGGSNTVRLGNASVSAWLPGATNVVALGSTLLGFKELYLSEGATIYRLNVQSGALTLTAV